MRNEAKRIWGRSEKVLWQDSGGHLNWADRGFKGGRRLKRLEDFLKLMGGLLWTLGDSVNEID